MTKYHGKAVNSGFGLATKLGSEMVSATAIGGGFGYWLDSQFDTTPWLLIIFMIFGVAAGFRNLYRAVESPRDEKAPTESGKKSVDSNGPEDHDQKMDNNGS